MSDQKKVLEQSRWSLADLYPSGGSSEMESAIKDLEARVAQFEKYREKLIADISAADFMRVIKDLEEITKLIQRLGGFAELWFAEDTQDQSAQIPGRPHGADVRGAVQPGVVFQPVVESAG